MGCCASLEESHHEARVDDSVVVQVRAGSNMTMDKMRAAQGKPAHQPPLTTRDIQVAAANERKLVRPDSATILYTPQLALKALMEGNARFVQGITDHPHQDMARLQKIAAKQAPFAAVLGCSDSRVPTEILFDQGFGDLFICRVAGAIATPEQVASLEYAVAELGVKLILVLGHARCGAVKTALAGKPCPGMINTLLDGLDLSVERCRSKSGGPPASPEQRLELCVKENVLYQMQRIQRSQVLAEAMACNAVAVAGAYYDLDTGRVVLLDEMLNKMICKTVASRPAPAALAQAVSRARAASEPVLPYLEEEEEEHQRQRHSRHKGRHG